MRLALLEAKIALIEVLKRYTFIRAPDTEVYTYIIEIKHTLSCQTLSDKVALMQVPLQLDLRMRPKNGICLKVITRS